MQRFSDLTRTYQLPLGIWNVNDDLKRMVFGKLACPSNNELFGIFVEISLTKRKRVQRVEELRNLLDTNLYGVWRGA